MGPWIPYQTNIKFAMNPTNSWRYSCHGSSYDKAISLIRFHSIFCSTPKPHIPLYNLLLYQNFNIHIPCHDDYRKTLICWKSKPGGNCDLVQYDHDDVIKWKHFTRYWPLWGEFTGDRWIPLTEASYTHRWIPLTKASYAELWCLLWSTPEQTVE